MICQLPNDLRTSRYGDQQKIHQVLTNLISNAIKFSVQGQIKLSLQEGYEDQVIFSLEDGGVGISKSDQQELFQPFSSISAESSGTGLGLSICQGFVTGMGGTISVASQLGIGTTFTVKLPLPVVKSEVPPVGREDSAEEIAPGCRVLSVDDDAVNRLVLERHLQALGCLVTSVENGQQAVDAFQNHSFDMVMMDLLMPVKDGFQAAREIRGLEQQSGVGISDRIPIVAITASVVGQVGQECQLAGMDHYLTKPFSRQQLTTVLSKLHE